MLTEICFSNKSVSDYSAVLSLQIHIKLPYGNLNAEYSYTSHLFKGKRYKL